MKAKVIECLRILLSETTWLQAIAECPSEFTALKNSLGTLLPEIEERLEDIVRISSSPGQAVQKPIMVGEDALEGDAREGKNLLVQGMRIMERFEWTYPTPSRGSSDRDAASEGFQNFATGVTKLSNFVQRESAKRDAELCLEDSLSDLSRLWADVVRFIASTRQERRPFASKVEFIVINLSRLSPSFRQAVQTFRQQGGPDLLAPRNSFDSDPEVVDVGDGAAAEVEVADEAIVDASEVPLAEDAFDSAETLLGAPIWKPGSKLQWMWADARVLPLPGMHKLAEMNPGRWSELRTPEELIAELQAQPGSNRRVQVRQPMQQSRKFPDVEAAVQWICAPAGEPDILSKTF